MSLELPTPPSQEEPKVHFSDLDQNCEFQPLPKNCIRDLKAIPTIHQFINFPNKKLSLNDIFSQQRLLDQCIAYYLDSRLPLSAPLSKRNKILQFILAEFEKKGNTDFSFVVRRLPKPIIELIETLQNYTDPKSEKDFSLIGKEMLRKHLLMRLREIKPHISLKPDNAYFGQGNALFEVFNRYFHPDDYVFQSLLLEEMVF